MPELPEVEVVRQGLAPLLAGRIVVGFSRSGQRLRAPVPVALLQQLIVGQQVKDVDRRAKYILIRMKNKASLVIHLGMSGRLGLFPAARKPAKHDHLRWRLDNGLELRFNDTRRFGLVQVLPPGPDHEKEFFRQTGPEPFSKDFSAAYLQKKAGNRQQAIKNFLMDSRVVAGIGNIYASEILFASRLAPSAPAATVSLDEHRRLVKACRQILKRAIASGGTTIADYLNAGGQPGCFQLQLMVYGREGQACRQCKTPISRIVLAGRSTYFCSSCQK